MLKLSTIAIIGLVARATFVRSIGNDISNRAVGDLCSAPEGTGLCLPTFDCFGITYPQNLCPNDPANVQCCVEIECFVPEGTGICRSVSRNGCDGSFIAGSGPPFPCPGDNDIQCCVS